MCLGFISSGFWNCLEEKTPQRTRLPFPRWHLFQMFQTFWNQQHKIRNVPLSLMKQVNSAVRVSIMFILTDWPLSPRISTFYPAETLSVMWPLNHSMNHTDSSCCNWVGRWLVSFCFLDDSLRCHLMADKRKVMPALLCLPLLMALKVDADPVS